MLTLNQIKTLFLMIPVIPWMFGIARLERKHRKADRRIESTPQSPKRFDLFMPASMRLIIQNLHELLQARLATMADSDKMVQVMDSVSRNMWYSLSSIYTNHESPKTHTDQDFLDELEMAANKLGVTSIGYTKLPRELIFQDLVVFYDNVIVLTMEMDQDKIAMAPSEATAMMVFDTYDALEIAANRLTAYLRNQGYAAQAGHPLGGQTLYPALAELAGLGWHGRHGLLITPQLGPSVRIATIYSSIENLPFSKRNPHVWIQEYCHTQCGHCIQKCPAGAIYEQPIIHTPHYVTHIDSDKCFPYFAKHYGCSICIKECSFFRKSYNKIKTQFHKVKK